MRKLPEGFRDAITREPPGTPFYRGTEAGPGPYQRFDIRMKGGSWPCQKPPWGLLTAVNANTGEIVWQVTLGVTNGLPESKKETGRLVLVGQIVTAVRLLVIESTADTEFHALIINKGEE